MQTAQYTKISLEIQNNETTVAETWNIIYKQPTQQ